MRWGGGTPSFLMSGVPHRVLTLVLHPSQPGVTPILPDRGTPKYPPLGLDEVAPISTGWGTPFPVGTGWGTPLPRPLELVEGTSPDPPPYWDWMGYPLPLSADRETK